MTTTSTADDTETTTADDVTTDTAKEVSADDTEDTIRSDRPTRGDDDCGPGESEDSSTTAG